MMSKGERSSMAEQSTPGRGTRRLLVVAAVVIILWGINQAQSVLVLFLVSFFLAVIGTAPVTWMERKRIPPVVAVLIVVAAMVTLLLSIGAVVGASLNGFSSALPSYQTRLHDMLIAAKALLARNGVAITDKVLLGYVNPEVVMNFIAALFSALSSVLSNIVLILFIVMFILLEAPSFPAKLRAVLDNPDAAFPQFKRFTDDIKRYMVIKTWINVLVGV